MNVVIHTEVIILYPVMCVCRFIRDFAYDNLANNRYSFFGKSDSCEIIE